MNEQQLESIKRKNAWLHNLVEVEFPTKESIEGREIYFRALEATTYEVVQNSTFVSNASVLNSEDIFLVDFHRLTVMFSVLQSQRWSSLHDQEMVVEYLSQIILDPDFELYVGFKDGEAVGAAIVSHHQGNTLFSDLVTSDKLDKEQFAFDLAKKIRSQNNLCDTIIVER